MTGRKKKNMTNIVAVLMKRKAEERELIFTHRERRSNLVRFKGTALAALCDFISPPYYITSPKALVIVQNTLNAARVLCWLDAMPLSFRGGNP